MTEAPRQDGERGRASKGKSFPLWGLAALVLAVLVMVLVFSWGGKEGRQAPIPAEALSRIEQEKEKARKGYADFIQTPAGKLWQKHPHWDPAACQRIAGGQVFTGMSREQAAEAVAKVEEIIKPKGGRGVEIWRAEGRRQEKWTLRFEDNTLVAVEGR